MVADLTTTMDALVECVCDALEAADRAACACGLTVGPPSPGPAGCCECDTSPGGSVSGFLERVYPADQTRDGIQEASRLENCRTGGTAADITLVVLRCYPSLDEQGNMPDLVDTTDAAHDLNTDMTVVWEALKCCGPNLVIRESAVDADPEGGCSAFAIRVSTLVNMVPAVDLDVS